MFKKLLLSLCLLFPLVVCSAEGPLEQLGKQIDQAAGSLVMLAKLAQDPLLNPLEIHVRIDNGVAILEGFVDTDIQYDRAVNLVKNLPGVEKVDTTNLKIRKSNQPMEDFWITTKIKAKLFRNRYFRGDQVAKSVEVNTKNGNVYVVGTAQTLDQKMNTLRLIKSTAGVKEIREDITLPS